MFKDFVLEIYSEEIPALMQLDAAKGFHNIFSHNFTEAGIKFKNLQIYISPCRIIVHAEDMQEIIDAMRIEKKGPKTSAPISAIEAFAASVNKDPKSLEVRLVKDSECYFYVENIPEKSVSEILPPAIIKSLNEYVWPKSMYWGDYKISWVRPLRNILCLFGSDVVEFDYGHIKSNNITFGHKFMSSGASIRVKHSQDYFEKLSSTRVIYDQDLRKKMILDQIQNLSKNSGYEVNMDLRLLDEVTGLIEYPSVMMGNIDEKFMSVPHEILTSAMRHHQKYFTMKDTNGNFASKFLFVSNNDCNEAKSNQIVAGNERVLGARLSDAAFFFNEDLKTTSEARYLKLSSVTFHAKLGSLKQKADRMQEIVAYLSGSNKEIMLAVKLAKSDLLSGAVGEFPELQGIMGSYYAKHEGFNQEICTGIRDHYKPLGPNDEPPSGYAAYVSIADKIDSLVGLYVAGERATGSKDPYALRRHALGIIRTILHNKFDLDIYQLVTNVTQLHSGTTEDIDAILNFIKDRLRNYYSETYDSKIINAIISKSNLNLIDIDLKLKVLKDFLSKPESESVLEIFRRANNILKQNPFNIEEVVQNFDANEQKFYDAMHEVMSKYVPLIIQADYASALVFLKELIEPTEEFFNTTFVITDDLEATKRRLLILEQLRGCIFGIFANFEEL